MPELKTSEQIATQLHVSARRVRQLAEQGVIPTAGATPGGHRRFDPEAVVLALELHRRYRFPATIDGESAPSLASEIPAAPLIRRRGRSGAITLAAVADAASARTTEPLFIPLIGEPGTSRYARVESMEGVPA